MFRLPSLLFAAVLMTSASAFAGNTPDPSSKGEAALPSGSKTEPPAGAPAVTENFNKLPAPGEKIPSPGEVNKGPGEVIKGKPPEAPE